MFLKILTDVVAFENVEMLLTTELVLIGDGTNIVTTEGI